MIFIRLFLLGLVIGAAAVSEVQARTLYEIRRPDGSVTFTYRNPQSNERYRVVPDRRPRKSRLISSRGWSARPQPSRYDSLIVNCASRSGLDPMLVKAVVHAESAFDERATSHKGAMGLMQLMPTTARRLGVRDPYEPEANVCGGSRYLKMLLEQFAGDIRLALAAYNAGPAAVERYSNVPPYRETIDYVRKVGQLHRRYRASGMLDG